MVYMATIVVKTVCAKELWIRSLITVKTSYQARIAGLMAEIGLAIMADRHQTLAAAWRQYGHASPLLYPVGPHRARERLQHPSVRPLPPSAFIPLSASSFAVRSARKHSSSAAVAVDGTNPRLATQSPPQPLHHHLSDSLRPPVPADHIR